MSTSPWLLDARERFGRAWLKTYGWTIEGVAPGIPKAGVCSAPHTTNWDLPFCLAICWALRIELAWIGKNDLFSGPAGPLMRALGGVAVDRTKSLNQVQAASALFEETERLLLMVPPEGTRGRAERWKTGFYYIALSAKVPIILGYLDYEKKCGGFGEVFWPTGNIVEDESRLRSFYAGKKGKFPDQATPVYFAPTQKE